MSRTNDLRKLIQSELKKVCGRVYYKIADEDALYPHIVFKIKSINTGDLSRSDYELQIDLWDNKSHEYEMLNLADEVEDLLKTANLPNETILPTFYTNSRLNVDDEDKAIRHIQISMQVQLYERK